MFLEGSVYLERDNDTDRPQSLFIYTHLYLQALIQVPSVTIQWIPMESGGIQWNGRIPEESVGHQKVQQCSRRVDFS